MLLAQTAKHGSNSQILLLRLINGTKCHHSKNCAFSTKSQARAFEYSSKVRAIPFKISPDEAVRDVSYYASRLHGTGIWSSLGAKLLPSWGFKALQPKSIHPVYFPAWMVDAEALARTLVPPSADELSLTQIQSMNSYMPGQMHDGLSLFSFSSPSLYDLAIPFTPDLKRQHDSEISCLPYTISPLSLTPFMKSFPNMVATIPNVMFFALQTISINVIAAYPIVFPAYILTYEVPASGELEEKKVEMQEVTFIIQAHVKEGLVYSYGRKSEEALLCRGPDRGLAHMSATTIISPTVKDSHEVDQRISEAVNHIWSTRGEDKLTQFGVDLDDPRVREYTEDEITVNRSWMALSTEVHRAKQALSMANSSLVQIKKELSEIGFGARDGRAIQVVADLVKKESTLKGAISALALQRQISKPRWQREYEISVEKLSTVQKKRKAMRMI